MEWSTHLMMQKMLGLNIARPSNQEIPMEESILKAVSTKTYMKKPKGNGDRP